MKTAQNMGLATVKVKKNTRTFSPNRCCACGKGFLTVKSNYGLSGKAKVCGVCNYSFPL